MLEKQTAGITKASKKKKEESLLKTEKAIAFLIEQNKKIAIRSVAREAGVSVSYIYKYPELAYKIQRLREQQKYSLDKSSKELAGPKGFLKDTLKGSGLASTEGTSATQSFTASHIASASASASRHDRASISGELTKEIEQKNSTSEAKSSKNSLENLRLENIRLMAENQQLKEELEYARQNLHQAREFILGKSYSPQNNFQSDLEIEVVQKTYSE